MKQLRSALLEGFALLHVEALSLEQIFDRPLTLAVQKGRLASADTGRVKEQLLRRETQLSTAIGHSVAVPHAYLDAFAEPLVIFVRLEHALNLGAPDGIPTRFLFVLLGPEGVGATHLDTLTAIARLMSDDEFRYEAGEAESEQEVLAALDRFQERMALPKPVGQRAVSDGLRFTGVPFGGIIADIRRRLPHYPSDLRDGLNMKCLAAVLFLFFACLAPTVSFGGIMGELTDGHIGVVEMILAVSLCNVVYALFAGTPVIILGGTGPLLVFTVTLYDLCLRIGLGDHFLPCFAQVGLWTALFVLILAVFDVSALMRFFTRFTTEIFAALISLIYIAKALGNLFGIFGDVYAEPRTSHDRALIPLLLAMGTFFIAINLSRFRRSRYLLPWMREFLADFGPTIAIAAMTLAAVGLHHLQQVDLNELSAPESIRPTLSVAGAGRPWLINPFSAPRWVWFAAALPAAFGTVLVFLDQNITARLINDPDHNLRKGESYHLDLAVIGVLTGVCSLFGLPWCVAATVRSLNHLRAVAATEEAVNRDGEVHEQIIHVHENRLTPLTIHLLVGGSLLLLPVIKLVPLSVLFGLFLFMGVVSMAGNQFFERLSLWLTEPSLYPRTHYVRRVPQRVIHLYTLVQLVCLAVMWIVQESRFGILFPLFIALLVPVRMLLARFFAPEHLAALDAEADPEEEETHWF